MHCERCGKKIADSGHPKYCPECGLQKLVDDMAIKPSNNKSPGILFSIAMRFLVFTTVSVIALVIGVILIIGFTDGANISTVILTMLYSTFLLPFYIIVFLPSKTIFRPPLIVKVYYSYVICIVAILSIVLSSSLIKRDFMNSNLYRQFKYNTICLTYNDTIKSGEDICIYNNQNLVFRLRPGETACSIIDKKEKVLNLRAVKYNDVNSNKDHDSIFFLKKDNINNIAPYTFSTKGAKKIYFIISPSPSLNGRYEWTVSQNNKK